MLTPTPVTWLRALLRRLRKEQTMKIVTVWESQIQYWGNTKEDPKLRIMDGRAFMFYVSRERANEASPGGPAIERKVLERDGFYFMMRRPYYGEVMKLPVKEEDIMNIQVFTSSDRYSDEISSLIWDEEMKRLGRDV